MYVPHLKLWLPLTPLSNILILAAPLDQVISSTIIYYTSFTLFATTINPLI